MADLVRWDPFQEMTSLRDAMNQLLAESFVRPSSRAGTFQPPVDLYETENEYVVKLAAPGLKPDNFEITMQQNMLTIQGRTQQEEKQEDARYHVREQRFGEFLRTVQFPSQVDADKIQASLSNCKLQLSSGSCALLVIHLRSCTWPYIQDTLAQ
jgi:HSP20 family protein